MDKASSSSSSNEKKYKGVRKRKWGKYVSEIRLPNSRDRIWLGSYDAAEKAARAFDAALFCLRGERANFNFPDDPPDIPGGQSLAPADIQVVAQQYAVSKPEFRAVELEDTSPSSNSEGAGRIDSIDWSFLDILDNGSGTGGNNAGSSVMDFGQLFPEPGEMFMQSRFTHDDIINYNGEEEEDGDRDGNGGDLPYFLWNF